MLQTTCMQYFTPKFITCIFELSKTADNQKEWTGRTRTAYLTFFIMCLSAFLVLPSIVRLIYTGKDLVKFQRLYITFTLHFPKWPMGSFQLLQILPQLQGPLKPFMQNKIWYKAIYMFNLTLRCTWYIMDSYSNNK